MQVLTRSNGAAPARVRVALDPSLSMSFALPATMRQPRKQHDAVVAAAALPVPVALQQISSSVSEQDDDADDSWETKDWNEQPAAAAVSTAASNGSGEAHATRRVVDTSMTVRRTADDWEAHDNDDEAETDKGDVWEEADAPELPDDFPLLIVNLSRLRDLHFRSEHETNGSDASTIAMDTDDELRAFYATVKDTLHAHFTQMTEVLFDQEVCFHTHYGAQRRMLENLHRAYPTHVFALIDYPPQLGGLDLHEYLHVLTTPTRWPSVNYLKDCLRTCSRDLEWKFEICIELERLAQQEHDWWTSEQQRCSDEIDALTRLRDSFRDKLRTHTGDDASATRPHASQYMLLRKLEDIETRLVTLIDAYLKEPALTARESRELMGFMDAAPSMQMRNVLDMVVAMIFSRLPRDYGTQPTNEAHFEMLLDHHLHIRRLWKKDFGRLPVRTGAGGEEQKEDDEEEEEETMPAVVDVGAPVDEGENMDDDDESQGEDEDAVADDWEAIGDSHDEEQTEEPKADTVEAATEKCAKPVADGLDGYGADYDSDESGSDRDDGEDESAGPQPTTAATRSVRRTRRTKKTRDADPFTHLLDRSPSPGVDRVAAQSERDRLLEAFMYGAGNSDSGSDGEQEGGRMFQSYARTGALQLLRRAKENEGF